MLKNHFFRTTITFTLLILVMFNLSACTLDDRTVEGREYDKYGSKIKSNMLKGLENPRSVQSTKAISSGLRAHSGTGTDASPATTQHANQLVYYWQDVSKVIDQLDGIAVAHVFVTNKNAYVGLMFTDEVQAQTMDKQGYDQYHRHEVAPRTLAAMPYDNYYTVENNANVTNQIYHDVGRLVNNYAAPRQVFISADHTFLHHLADLARIDRKQRTVQPYLHEFNVLVQYYFADGQTEPLPIKDDKRK